MQGLRKYDKNSSVNQQNSTNLATNNSTDQLYFKHISDQHKNKKFIGVSDIIGVYRSGAPSQSLSHIGRENTPHDLGISRHSNPTATNQKGNEPIILSGLQER